MRFLATFSFQRHKIDESFLDKGKHIPIYNKTGLCKGQLGNLKFVSMPKWSISALEFPI